ncbi:Uncharacterized protein PECH_004989 [Penicillium ucsense]|uniref:Uncharacterized protein n=1 Tax=Penicillium ucsense TaxID=2839758 RepID=A0A8J8VYV7_9EURO|nr:Uncharacterized protein PECM_008876 [Penicillium ucsense]KAF7736774.1 Uncharacterized protein PECH_004989 [Penicillium ucsense]
MSDTRLVDMEPGGENTQYESIREHTIPPAKQSGQLGGDLPHTRSEMKTTLDSATNNDANVEDAKLAEELGMGEAAANTRKEQGGSGTLVDAEAAKSRREQGYGPGSGVGA